MDDLISRQTAITIPILPKEHRKYQTMNLDDAYELGWFDCQKCVEDLPSAQPEIAENLYMYKCYITDKDGLQHEVIHTDDIRRVTGWEI